MSKGDFVTVMTEQAIQTMVAEINQHFSAVWATIRGRRDDIANLTARVEKLEDVDHTPQPRAMTTSVEDGMVSPDVRRRRALAYVEKLIDLRGDPVSLWRLKEIANLLRYGTTKEGQDGQ